MWVFRNSQLDSSLLGRAAGRAAWPGWKVPGPYLPFGNISQPMTQIPDPPQDRLLHSSGFRAGEVQQHLEKEKLQMSPGSKHPLQQEQCDSAPGQDFHGPSRLPLTLSKVLMGSCSRSPLQAWDKGPGQPCCKADAILCSHSTPKELGASPWCSPQHTACIATHPGEGNPS